MRIDVSRGAQATHVELAGELDMDNAAELGSRLEGLVADGSTRMTVDLRQLTFCDSRGMATLLAVASRCRAAGGLLTVTGATGNVARAMAITGVDELLGARREGSSNVA